MISLFLTLFGCIQINKTDKKDIFPKEKFVIWDTTIDGNPVVGTFNVAYKDYNQKTKYPWCLKISIALNLDNLFENGLPKNVESDIAYKLEHELVDEIQKITVAHYLGHLFNDTFLDIYIYLDNPEKVNKYLQTQINKEGLIRGFGYKIEMDSIWEKVKDFIN